MFTGIVECMGIVRKAGALSGSAGILEIEVPITWKDVKVGSSVAVNGACLTVVKRSGKRFFFNVIRETRSRTVLSRLHPGQAVNLERAMKIGARFEGHVVLGHVDGVGKVLNIKKEKEQISFLIAYPKSLKTALVEKGSVAINGVSMTLGKVLKNAFWVHCIPHTFRQTRFGSFKTGDRVNLEGDILAKFSRLSR